MTTDTGPPQAPSDVIFKRGAQNVLTALFLIIVASFSASGMDNNNPLGWRIFWAVAVVALACLAVRCWRVAIIAGPDQLVVRNHFHTVRVSWKDITRFEPPQGFQYVGPKMGLRIHLANGRVISASAFMPLIRVGNDWRAGGYQKACAAVTGGLEELHHQRIG